MSAFSRSTLLALHTLLLILFGNVFTHVALNFNLHISPRAQRGSAGGVRVRFDETKDIFKCSIVQTPKKVEIRSFQARVTRESYLRSDFKGEVSILMSGVHGEKCCTINDFGSIPGCTFTQQLGMNMTHLNANKNNPQL